MLSKLFREINNSSPNFFFYDVFPSTGKAISFPKEEDPNFNYEKESVEKEQVITTKETWTSTDGSTTFSRIVSQPKQKETSLPELKQKLKAAVEAEDYELAAKLKKEIEKKKGE